MARGWWRPPAFTFGLAILLAILWTIGRPRYETAEMRADRAQLEAAGDDRAVVLGSSHAFGLVLKKIGESGTNFGRGGTDLFELDYKVEVLLDRLPHLRDAYLAISYFSFALDNAAYREEGVQTRIGRRIRLYRAFPHLGFIAGDLSSYLKAHLYPLLTEDHWRAVWSPKKRKSGDRRPRGDRERPGRKHRTARTAEWLAASAAARCAEYRELLENVGVHHEDVAADARQALEDAIARMRRRGVRVTLFIPPFHHSYNECFPVRYQDDARRMAAEAAAATGARFFDFSRSESISGEDGLFEDADHLDPSGRRLFAHLLRQALDGAEDP